MISIKDGAKIMRLQPEMCLGLMAIDGVFEKWGYQCVITEGTGGQHMENSLHYKGYAVDIRTKTINNAMTKVEIVRECKEALGKDFDVILECEGKDNEHMHVEFDPK